MSRAAQHGVRGPANGIGSLGIFAVSLPIRCPHTAHVSYNEDVHTEPSLLSPTQQRVPPRPRTAPPPSRASLCGAGHSQQPLRVTGDVNPNFYFALTAMQPEALTLRPLVSSVAPVKMHRMWS